VKRLGAVIALVALPILLFSGQAGADTSLVGYNAGGLAIGAQFTFNVPNVVPLPNENLIEEDVPFARTTVGSGPVVDSVGAPYYPGDIAADLGSLLQTFGAPALPLNDQLLAESKYPTSPGYPASKSFGVQPSAATAAQPSIFSSTADASESGGDATGTDSHLSLDNLAGPAPSLLGATAAPSLLDVGNVSASDTVAIGNSSITATSTSEVSALDVAGLVDIAGLTSTAVASSDGTTGTPTATLHLGQVTVDGQPAYIDATGVHIPTTNPPASGITPAQLQQTVDATLSQDGISITLLNPQLTTNGAAATANAGGLVIAISHQFDVPFIPGEPTIPVPQLGNVGLPAGLYTATTSITFGLAQSNANASGLSSQVGVLPTVSVPPTAGPTTTPLPVSTVPATSTFSEGVGGVQSLAPSGPGSAAGSGVTPTPVPVATATTGFPIRGVPAPLGWTISALLACILAAYPLLLLARWQFVAGRRT
jgi:hypothetical protein